jgi:hypothetical protein
VTIGSDRSQVLSATPSLPFRDDGLNGSELYEDAQNTEQAGRSAIQVRGEGEGARAPAFPPRDVVSSDGSGRMKALQTGSTRAASFGP